MYEQIETPAILVDLAIIEQNLRAMAAKAADRGLKLRPHTKTHKNPDFARRQVELGAEGITVAKLSEAEVMLMAGFTNQLIAYPIVGKEKAHRLAALMVKGLSPTVSTDSLASLQTLQYAAELAESTVDILIEVDTGFHRCGLAPGPAVLECAQAVGRFSRLRFRGLMSFAGHISGRASEKEIQVAIETDDDLLHHEAQALEKVGIPVPVISVGGTILSHNMEYLRYATEIRPGIYIFNDMGIVTAGCVTLEQCGLRILGTVVSRPHPNRLVLDCGSKTLSSDGPIQGSFGHVIEHSDWKIVRLSEEHAVVETQLPILADVIGTKVQIIPNHVCPVVNLHDALVGVKGDKVVQSIPVVGRGKIL